MNLNRFFLILISLIHSIVFSQYKIDQEAFPLTNKLTFYNIDTEQGLSNNIIKSIEEDSLGFIWIGTSDGLNRYDGSEFKIFRRENSMLSNNYIQNISLNNTGEIILATDGGLNIYNPKQEAFDLLNKYNPHLKLSINSYEDLGDGTYAIGIYNQGLLIYKGMEEQFYFGKGDQNTNGLSSVKVSCLAQQKETVWVGFFDSGLDKFDLKSHKIKHIPLKINNNKVTQVNTLFIDQLNNLWIGTNRGLIGILESGEQITLTEGKDSQSLTNNQVLAIEEDDLGKLWVGTYKGGLNVFDIQNLISHKKNFNIIKYTPKENGTSVYNASINALKKDRNGFMWIGTNAGINFVDPAGEAIKLIKNNLTGGQKLVHNRINGMFESKNGNIYLATDGGGVDTYNPETGLFNYAVLNTNNGLTTDHLNTIFEDTNNTIWIATYQGGLNRYDLKTNKWQYYLQGENKDGSDVRCLYEAQDGSLWVGTNRGGLYKYDSIKNKFDYVDDLDKISSFMDIRAIDEDSEGVLWMATYGNGIIRYNPKTADVYSYFNGNLEGLTNNVVFCIKVLDDNSIVAGLKYGGIVHFKQGENTALNLTEANGLSNNTVNSILVNDAEIIFLGTYKGISKYNYKEETVESLNSFNNIQKSEYNIGATFKSKSGYVYFGGNKGLNVFKPEQLQLKSPNNKIIIKDFKLFNKNVPVTSDQPKSLLTKSILYTDKIQLKYDQTNFSLDFTNLNYPFASNTNYSYSIEGYDDHWVDLKNSTRINFSNLTPGDYTLKIKAQNQGSSPIFKDLKIAILPPIWKTIPAYLFYIVLLVFLFWASLNYYADRIKLKNSLIFEKKQRQLEQELNEERIRFYTGFSHELKTPLTLILAPLENLLNTIDHKEHRNSLKLIRRNANNLLQFINKLLEFRKSEEGLSKLNINEYNLSKHLSKWLSTYKPLLKKKNIELMVSMPHKAVKFYCDLEKLHIIINNLISNAIKYSENDGIIEVRLTQNDKAVTLSVSDSGCGIHENDLNNIFEWYYQSNTAVKKDGTGIGLALSKRFAELHNGSLTVTSKAKKGSTFTLEFPKDDRLVDAFLEKSPNALSNKKAVEKRIQQVDIEVENTNPKKLLIQKDDSRKLLLLIDDNTDILEFLDSALADKYDLIHAENGEEGIAQACKYIPDLIISDIMMPVKNGIDLCHFLKNKKETSHIPIVLLSAKSNFEMIETGYMEGADDYMLKPFNLSVLKARVENLIENRSKLLQRFAESNLSEADNDHKKLLDIEKEFLTEFHKIIFDNMQQGIKTVEVVCEQIGMSRSSLYRKIKAITGQNINEYIRNIKIERAAYLIEKENFTVSQASYEVGFSDAKYFRKIFKEKYGKTPSSFKQN